MSEPLVAVSNRGGSNMKQFSKLNIMKKNYGDMMTLEKPPLEKQPYSEYIHSVSHCESTKSKELVHQTYGFVGLSNLGNTCFMNCMLQALANVEELRCYFVTENFRADVNRRNRSGTFGKLAEEFYITLKHLWSPSPGVYSPRGLVAVLAKHVSQFKGFLQHDAQEFLTLFLDLLHEDVNRVVEKPVFKLTDMDSHPDKVVGKEFWKLHKSRNDSMIVDIFHGMLKSKLTCQQCHKQSTAFDPLVFLPVPIPECKIRICAIFCGISIGPVYFELPISGNEKVSHLLRAAGNKFDVPVDNLKVFKVNSSNFSEQLSHSASLSFCRYATLIVLEEDHCKPTNCRMQTVVVVQRQRYVDICATCGKDPKSDSVKNMRCTKCKSVGYCSKECQRKDWVNHKSDCHEKFVGLPFIMHIPETPSRVMFLSNLSRWLEFTSNITGPDLKESGDNVLNIDTLERNSAFTLYKCSTLTLKETTVLLNNQIDLSDATRIIFEFSADITVSPKVLVRSGTSDRHALSDCLSLFTEPEVLAGEDVWHCPQCKKNREATKELSLWKLPDVLVIQLKRFSLPNGFSRQKIDRLVEFPIEGLDMRQFCSNDDITNTVYDLFAVANHQGSPYGGHYTSYVRSTADSSKEWRYCDDGNVTRVQFTNHLITKSAYVLFYRKRSILHSSHANENCLSNGLSNGISDINPGEYCAVKSLQNGSKTAVRDAATSSAGCSIHPSEIAEFYTDMDVVD